MTDLILPDPADVLASAVRSALQAPWSPGGLVNGCRSGLDALREQGWTLTPPPAAEGVPDPDVIPGVLTPDEVASIIRTDVQIRLRLEGFGLRHGALFLPEPTPTGITLTRVEKLPSDHPAAPCGGCSCPRRVHSGAAHAGKCTNTVDGDPCLCDRYRTVTLYTRHTEP